MKQVFLIAACLLYLLSSCVENPKSPDEKTELKVGIQNGIPYYTLLHEGSILLPPSPLGLQTSLGDFTKELKLNDRSPVRGITDSYTLNKGKKRDITYQANEKVYILTNPEGLKIEVVFQLSNNNVAFCYRIPETEGQKECTIMKENTGFAFPEGTTTFITPQALPMSGWMNTKPSYEEYYTNNEPIRTASQYGIGYTYPALFKVNDEGWVLISETGVDSKYVGTCLSEADDKGVYYVQFPQEGENNGQGVTSATAQLPMQTSWKTITLGKTLHPIVETTIATDVVKPKYEASETYLPGRSTWSWLVWQDNSINYEDQITFIDLAHDLKFEYVLIDNWWDARIGRNIIEATSQYAKDKKVRPILWYNSNGNWNNAPQTPQDCMDTAEARQKEMAWMQRIGVKGIKVDFFGGDKQVTLKLYEDILTDANKYGICVNFHGSNIPRGWERMFPNYMTSEAVFGMENCIFQQQSADRQADHCTVLPFTRNTTASMDFTPTVLNARMSKEQTHGTIRRTSATFELALPVVFLSPLQHFGLTPNNLDEQPDYVLNYLKNVPVVWDDTRLIDGYPGEYCVIARKKNDKWYIGAINGKKETRDLTIDISFMGDKDVTLLTDGSNKQEVVHSSTKEKTIKLSLQPEGGAVIYNE